MTLAQVNALDCAAAVEVLRQCCASTEWAARMAAARPFAGVDAMIVTSTVIWSALGEADWREAFAGHPAIGDRPGAAGAGGTGRTAAWSEQEQSGVAAASPRVLERLASKNREYAARFGYIFIICATGRSAGEMLDALERRLRNDAATEIRVAADEQRKITALRLRKLVDETATR